MLSFCRGKEKGMNRIMTYLIAGIMITIMAAVLLLNFYYIVCVIIQAFQHKKYGREEQKQTTKLRDLMLYLSYAARRERKLNEYIEQIDHYKCMDEDELNFEYVNVKTDYEHKKGIFSLFVITIMLSILANAWKYIYVFMQKALQYSATQVESEMIAKVSFEIATIILITITLIVFWVLLENAKDIKKLQRKLMMIQIVMKEQGNG